MTPITTTTDGTQIWKITHNGVDTHPIHFHLFDVQIINRVGWDGIIRKPDPNEIGWKDTLRISPLEDTIVAMRPIVPKVPFGLTESVRPLNPMMPLGSPDGFVNLDMYAQPIVPPITNELTNFGWEYVWHCHILSHEEMDMMRPMTVAVNVVTPGQPLAGFTPNGDGTVTVAWTDPTPVSYSTILDWGNPANEVGFGIERGIADGGGNVATWTQIGNAMANATRFLDTSPGAGNIRYRIAAWNAAGVTYSATAFGSLVIPPATGVILTSSQPSPQAAGTAVTFTAAGEGASGYQYRFWRYDYAAAAWSVVQDWSSTATWTQAGTTPAGFYRIVADVRTDPASIGRDAFAFVDYQLLAPPATGVTLTPSAPSPQVAGTDVIFTAAGQGSSGYLYRFWQYDFTTATWSVVQDWSATATWTLAGTTPAGTYRVVADVKTDPLSDVRDAFTFINYDLVAQAPATGVILTPSVPSPQAAGTAVIFTAAGVGSAGYEYRFWEYDYTAAAWTVVQDWSATDTWTLVGTTPAGLYRVVADVKTNPATTIRDAFTYIDYSITP